MVAANGGGGGGGGVVDSGLEQMEESLSEGNREFLSLLWSSSTRGKYQSMSSLGWHQPSMMLVPLGGVVHAWVGQKVMFLTSS